MLAQTGTGTRAVGRAPARSGRTRRRNGVAGGRGGEASRLAEQVLRRLSQQPAPQSPAEAPVNLETASLDNLLPTRKPGNACCAS